MTTDPQETFIRLKLFPRSKNGSVDNGDTWRVMHPGVECPECGHGLVETVSIEFCPHCGHVETDYWGIVKRNVLE